jgi:hypothetical protein
MAEKVLVEIEVDESGAVKDLKKIEVAIKGATLSFDQLNDTIQEQEKITADFRIELGKLKEKFSEVGGSGTIAGLAIEKRMISLNTAINDNVQSVKKLKIDKAQSQETIKGLEAQEKAAKGLTKELKKTKSDGFDLIKGGLNDISNGAVTSFGKIQAGAKIAVKSFGLVKTAVISTGIGALVVIVASLIAFFVKTEKGAQALRVIFAGLGAVVETLTNVFVNIGEAIFDAFNNPKKAAEELGEAITNYVTNAIGKVLDGLGLLGSAIKKAFSGDFDGALEDATEGAKKLADGLIELNPATAVIKVLAVETGKLAKELDDTVTKMTELEDATNKLKVRERELKVQRSQAKKEFAELRAISQDVTKSDKERLEASEKSLKIEEELLQKELSIEKERVRIAEEKVKLPGDEEEALLELAEAQEKLIDTETKSLNFARESTNEKNRLIQKGVDDRLDAFSKIREALIDENVKEVFEVRDKYAELIRLAEKYGQDTLELERLRQGELDLIRQEQALKEQEAFFKRAAVEIETKKESESAIDDIINSAIFANIEKNERELQSDKDFAKFKVDLAQQVENMKLNIASQAIGAATSLAREGSALAKGLAVAQVTFDTIRGIQSTFATQAANVAAGVATGGAWPYIQAASAAVFGFANVSKILSTPISGGGGGGGGSSRGGGASGPSAPSVSQSIGIVAPNQGQQGIGQQIQDGLGGATIRAYAVGQDISNQQQLDRQIASNGSFG